MDIKSLFLALSLTGGAWILYLLVGLSLISIAIIIERLLYFRADRTRPDDLAERALDHLGRGKLAEAALMARAATGPEARLLAAALAPADPDAGRTEQRLAAGLLDEQRRIERRVLFLGTLGANAPFIGLLGTVLGIIRAFYDLSAAGTGGPSVVMRGIAEALIATALGLGVAIPAVIAYNFFQRRVRNRRQRLEQFARAVVSALAGRGA